MPFRPIVLTVATDPSLPPFERHGEPVSIGVACPRGAVGRAAAWSLTDERGRAVPVQTTPLDRWGDGSVRWLLAEFQADVLPGVPSHYALAPGEPAAPLGSAVAVEHAGEVLRVATGAITVAVPRSGPGFLTAVDVLGGALLRSAAITAEDERGTPSRFVTRRATVERAGPLRAVVRLDGHLEPATGPAWLDVTVRLHCYAGLGAVTVEVAVTNPRAARHPGGAWDLGDPGSAQIRDLSITLDTDDPGAEAWGSLDHDGLMAPAGPRFAVYQASSGGAHWQHLTHVNRDGRVPLPFRGFRAVCGGRDVSGLRASPIASLGGGASRLSVTVPRFWQLFPKAIEAGGGRCRIGMFPREHGEPHELQGGERSTLALTLCFGRDTVSAEPLAWARAPLSVAADPIAYRQAGAWAPLAVGSPLSAARYEALVDSAIAGPRSFAQRREDIDEYGWRNFGDLYADHEAAGPGAGSRQPGAGPAPALVSHYNNQYDALAGFLTRFMQTGDSRWWTLGHELAAHVADIDLYHTDRDRAAYNGGAFWHTQHYQAAGTATHRAYSRRSGTSGGGPSSEHNYTTGLMLHYFLTGAEPSRAAVLQLANWVIDMDDGGKSRFRWIDRRDTGLASMTRSPDFHGPGRGAGNSINALLDAHRLTGEPRYLEKADALVARVAHPDDDPEAIRPLDAENRWSYTVFLQVLGKYLEHRADRGLVDARYAAARAVLLKWAMWMCANERPYLDRPETLEYPTETWAAQDLRKAAVFEFAARHTTDEAARACFLARAGGFFDYAVSLLQQSPTGRLTRPLVLLLAYGFQRPASDLAALGVGEAPPALPETFPTLRERLARRLAWAGAGLSAAVLLLAVLLAT
jgi:hypothetical protein